MDNTLKEDLSNQEGLLKEVVSTGMEFLSRINHWPTSRPAAFTPHRELPSGSSGGLNALAEFRDRFEQIMVSSGGPRYWGFVTGGSTPAAIMGDFLATIYDQNTQTAKGQGDISASIEFEALGMLRQLFSLPESFRGGFVTGATMSNFTCLAVARQWLGAQKGLDIAKDGMQGRMPVLSAVPHSSALKALAMSGIGSRHVIRIATTGPDRERMDMDDLEKNIQQLKAEPFILITSGGTVNTVDFDDMKAVASLKERYSFWWHVDAAFGGFAAISDKTRHLLEGWEHADSITIDGHKWLNVPYDNAFFFIKSVHQKLQLETFQNSNAPYLGDPEENFNFLNFLPENSRRCRALPVWFTLKAYGKDGYIEIIERNIAQAHMLGNFISESKGFELLAPVRLNTVCFTLKNVHREDQVKAFLTNLNDRGKVFMTGTYFGNRSGVRAAIVNWRTTDEDIIVAWKEMEEVYRDMSF